jgi:hemerythrin superfamily protein
MAVNERRDDLGELAGEPRPASLDAIQILEAQHRAVERLFTDLSRGAGGKPLRPLLVELADLLTAHATLEEQHFYPAARSAETEHLLEDSYDDHREVKEIVLHLLDVGPLYESFDAEVAELQALVAEHVANEEMELFPHARTLLDDERLQAIGEEMTATLLELQEEGSPHEHLVAELES